MKAEEEKKVEEEEGWRRTGGGGGGGGPVDGELLGGAAERTKHRAGGEGGASVGEGADPLDQGHGGQQVAQQLLHEPLASTKYRTLPAQASLGNALFTPLVSSECEGMISADKACTT